MGEFSHNLDSKSNSQRSTSASTSNRTSSQSAQLKDKRSESKSIHNKAYHANSHASAQMPSVQRKSNNTGLPDNLKFGVENLSGYSMDDVKVHYNSSKPAQLNAHAYAQGSDIHLASGQEKHLPHEAWHVVQQKQGRVKPTMQMKEKVNINDDSHLEQEADRMGAKALQMHSNSGTKALQRRAMIGQTEPIQRLVIRARDLTEMASGKMSNKWKEEGTIYSSSKTVKNRDELSGDPSHSKDVGIGQIDDSSPSIGADEPVFVVAHGGKPSPTFFGWLGDIDNKFAQRRANDLADVFRKITPPNYSGEVYLDGCYTGMRYKKRPGTSYIEKFDTENVTTGSIKGNVGPAITTKDGEIIGIDKKILNEVAVTYPAMNIILKYKNADGKKCRKNEAAALMKAMYESYEKDNNNYKDMKLYVNEADGTAKVTSGTYSSKF